MELHNLASLTQNLNMTRLFRGVALGCLPGTFSPSRRQIRSTRLSLTTQPAEDRRSSAIFR
jgi:penicillin V acylase-like amidase (Ntn superfamily)